MIARLTSPCPRGTVPAMKHSALLIVDGYNVIRSVPDLDRRLAVSLEKGREALEKYCRDWLAARGDFAEFCIVYDGDSAVCGGEERRRGGAIRTVFSRSGETADERIVKILTAARGVHRATVVSNDSQVVRFSRSLGAATMSVEEFAGFVRQSRAGRPARANAAEESDKPSPSQEQAINASLLKEWGLEE